MDIPRALLKATASGTFNLDVLRAETIETTCKVDYVSDPIPYADFFKKYLLPNKACVLGPWATEGWRSRNEWVNEDNTPNLDLLSDNFGDAVAPVANCGQELYSAQPKTDMTIKTYIEYLRDYSSRGSDVKMDCLYLKDWHFTRVFPEYEAYSTPVYFRSDWLNEFWAARRDQSDDYRFVYIGPKGSWTPFHADVFRSYSWSSNICGCKLWWLFPPGEEKYLKDKYGQLAYDLRSPDLLDKATFPNYQKSVRKLEVYQKAGEVIFVPSGWHHQVFNMQDTISINHNWLNGCNIDLSWKFIKSSLSDVKREISDCKDMEGWNQQCQLVLKASSGIDYIEFFNFINIIGKRRIDYLKRSSCSEQTDTRCKDKHNNESTSQTDSNFTTKHYYDIVDPRHAVFDLMRVKVIVKDMLKSQDFNQIDPSNFMESPLHFLHKIEQTLNDYSFLS